MAPQVNVVPSTFSTTYVCRVSAKGVQTLLCISTTFETIQEFAAVTVQTAS